MFLTDSNQYEYVHPLNLISVHRSITWYTNCTRGGWKIIRIIRRFAHSQKTLNIFQKFFLFLFKVFTTYTYLPTSGVLLYSLCRHEVDLLLRYQFTTEIKAILVSYLFPVSHFFQFWKQIKVKREEGEGGEEWVQGLCCMEGGATFATWRSW